MSERRRTPGWWRRGRGLPPSAPRRGAEWVAGSLSRVKDVRSAGAGPCGNARHRDALHGRLRSCLADGIAAITGAHLKTPQGAGKPLVVLRRGRRTRTDPPSGDQTSTQRVAPATAAVWSTSRGIGKAAGQPTSAGRADAPTCCSRRHRRDRDPARVVDEELLQQRDHDLAEELQRERLQPDQRLEQQRGEGLRQDLTNGHLSSTTCSTPKSDAGHQLQYGRAPERAESDGRRAERACCRSCSSAPTRSQHRRQRSAGRRQQNQQGCCLQHLRRHVQAVRLRCALQGRRGAPTSPRR